MSDPMNSLAPIRRCEAFPLWQNAAPHALGSRPEDIPTLTPFLPDPAKSSGAAMVVCPGGGYVMHANHEGEDYALWLAENGIAAFVLKYRLGADGYRHPVMLFDAARSIRTVRSRAAEWGVDPGKIGIMGSSAGGHLASTLLTRYDGGDLSSPDAVEHASSRPDLGILCYAVITLSKFGHQGSKENLLGPGPDPGLVDSLSNETRVTPDTPPCFIWHTWEDATVPVENSLAFAAALRKSGVRFDLHIFEKGSHGLGLVNRRSPHNWAADCLFWLGENGFLK